MKKIGTIEILADRTYPLDPYSANPESEAVVSPGKCDLYKINDSIFWLMMGKLNVGGMQPLGDGLFTVKAWDELSDIDVKIPSRFYGPDEWAELLAHPICTEDHPSQRLRVRMD